MTITPISAEPVVRHEREPDPIDPQDPVAIMARLAEVEDKIATCAPTLSFHAGRLVEMKDTKKRIELAHWPGLPVTKLAKDRDAQIQALLEADPSNIPDQLVAAEANYEAYKVAFDALERRASILQSLLKRHSTADGPAHHGQGSHHR